MQKRLLALVVVLAIVCGPITGLVRAQADQTTGWTIPKGYKLKHRLLTDDPIHKAAWVRIWLEDAAGNSLEHYPHDEEGYPLYNELMLSVGDASSYTLEQDIDGPFAEVIIIDFEYDKEYEIVLKDTAGNGLRAERPFVVPRSEASPRMELAETEFLAVPDEDGTCMLGISGVLFGNGLDSFSQTEYEQWDLILCDTNEYSAIAIEDFLATDDGFSFSFKAVVPEKGAARYLVLFKAKDASHPYRECYYDSIAVYRTDTSGGWTIPVGSALKYRPSPHGPYSLYVWLEDSAGNCLPASAYPSDKYDVSKVEFKLQINGKDKIPQLRGFITDEAGNYLAYYAFPILRSAEEYIISLADHSGNVLIAEQPYTVLYPEEPAEKPEEPEQPEEPAEKPEEPAPVQKLRFTVGQAGYTVDGEQCEMVAAYKEDGHTMVPVRMLQELGAQFKWHQATKTATFTLEGKTVKITQDSTQAIVNDETVVMPVAPKNLGNRLMIPVRFISENLGLGVLWRAGDIITISLPEPKAEDATEEPGEEPTEPGEPSEDGEGSENPTEEPVEPSNEGNDSTELDAPTEKDAEEPGEKEE